MVNSINIYQKHISCMSNLAYIHTRRTPFFVGYLLSKNNKNVIGPLLDDWLKGGNSQSPERSFLCNHFGVCLYVCDQATGHSFRPSNLIF